MHRTQTMELDGALGLLRNAGLTYTLVDRCPIESCTTCGGQVPKALPTAA